MTSRRDTLGNLFTYGPTPARTVDQLPPAPWFWTDDTAMALGVAEILRFFGYISPDHLADALAQRFSQDPTSRHYEPADAQCLYAIITGTPWRTAAQALFAGQGSCGNGGAARVAPLGAFLYDTDLYYVADMARISAAVTHAHPEGQSGAIAVAVAASLVAGADCVGGPALLDRVIAFLPAGDTRRRLEVARDLPAAMPPLTVAGIVGSGNRASAMDTVPFCLWVVAHHLPNYEQALWTTVQGRGDVNTTCAIVGGIVALAAGSEIPPDWRERRERLPAGYGEPI